MLRRIRNGCCGQVRRREFATCYPVPRKEFLRPTPLDAAAKCSVAWFAEVGASNTLPVLHANSQSEDAPRADFPVAALATFLRCALCQAAVQQRKCRSENSDRKKETFKFVTLSEGEIEEVSVRPQLLPFVAFFDGGEQQLIEGAALLRGEEAVTTHSGDTNRPEYQFIDSRELAARWAVPESCNPMVPLMTLDEVAARLGVSKSWVRDHATRRNPRMPVVRFGERRAVLRFRREDVEAFINSNLRGGSV